MKLFSRIYGEGDPLIILHGLFGMSDNWNTLGKRFSESFNVHVLDLRNHGRSPHADEFNYDVMCNDLSQYIEDNNLKDVILVGHSLGGKLVMKYAFEFSENIKKMIVVDIAPREYDVDFHKNLLNKLLQIPLNQFKQRKEVENVMIQYGIDKNISLFLLKNLYRDDFGSFLWRFNLKVLASELDNIKPADFITGELQIPTLFIKGEKSNYITEQDEIFISKYFKEVNFCTINNAGHWVHAENQDDFYRKALDFCYL